MTSPTRRWDWEAPCRRRPLSLLYSAAARSPVKSKCCCCYGSGSVGAAYLRLTSRLCRICGGRGYATPTVDEDRRASSGSLCSLGREAELAPERARIEAGPGERC